MKSYVTNFDGCNMTSIDFDPDRTSYHCEVPYEITELFFDVIPMYMDAGVAVRGYAFHVGDNNVIIQVEPEYILRHGHTDAWPSIDHRNYLINVHRLENNVSQLRHLEVDFCTLAPKFQPDIYNYTCLIHPNFVETEYFVRYARLRDQSHETGEATSCHLMEYNGGNYITKGTIGYTLDNGRIVVVVQCQAASGNAAVSVYTVYVSKDWSASRAEPVTIWGPDGDNAATVTIPDAFFQFFSFECIEVERLLNDHSGQVTDPEEEAQILDINSSPSVTDRSAIWWLKSLVPCSQCQGSSRLTRNGQRQNQDIVRWNISVPWFVHSFSCRTILMSGRETYFKNEDDNVRTKHVIGNTGSGFVTLWTDIDIDTDSATQILADTTENSDTYHFLLGTMTYERADVPHDGTFKDVKTDVDYSNCVLQKIGGDGGSFSRTHFDYYCTVPFHVISVEFFIIPNYKGAAVYANDEVWERPFDSTRPVVIRYQGDENSTYTNDTVMSELSIGNNTFVVQGIIDLLGGRNWTNLTGDTYTFIVEREYPDAAHLNSLKLSGCENTLRPPFHPSLFTGYQCLVPYSTSISTIVDVQALHEGAQITPQFNPNSSLPVGHPGINVSIIVTAPNAFDTNTYFIEVERKEKDHAWLDALNAWVDKEVYHFDDNTKGNECNFGHKGSPTFDKDIYNYSCVVDKRVQEIYLNATVGAGTEATISYQKGAIPLMEGHNQLDVVVTAKDHITTQNYVVDVIRADDAAYLVDLEIDNCSLTSDQGIGFRPLVTFYWCNNIVQSVGTLRYTKINDDQQVKILPNDGNFDDMPRGISVVTVTVIAQDELESQNYQILVFKEEDNFDECASFDTPCSDHGTCNTDNPVITYGYNCVCNHGWSGDYCEKAD